VHLASIEGQELALNRSGSLLVHLLHVELELLALEDVAVGTTTLAGARGDASQEAAGLELVGDLGVDNSVLGVGSDLSLHVTGLLGLGSELISLLNLLGVELDIVLAEVPEAEGVSVDGNDSVLHDRLGSDQLVVGGVIDNIDDLSLAGKVLRAPGEVSVVDTESTELQVSTSAAHGTNARSGQLGVSGKSTQLELSLLLVDGHAAGRGSSFVS